MLLNIYHLQYIISFNTEFSTISSYITSTLIIPFESITKPKRKIEDDRLGSPTAAHSRMISTPQCSIDQV
jgi:hypothetical protein